MLDALSSPEGEKGSKKDSLPFYRLAIAFSLRSAPFTRLPLLAPRGAPFPRDCVAFLFAHLVALC
jgi:hypothetical protein